MAWYSPARRRIHLSLACTRHDTDLKKGNEEDGDDELETTNETTPSFEEAIERLEKLVTSLEGGELGLEASVDAYEEGLSLARQCVERLDRAELRVQQLSELTGREDVDHSE